ncbi:LysM peptidoglycan-binding domain-containing protein [Kitasatospora azatica]|uniref:LysM peptidoglycan-binding domain-containing protein n=1 Tax=Kitasatospora azatica TaxID=58347 RepID=UPI000ADD9328|nr:LysM peptidoglycan-binding domain-containing protein [Kitasatospora azatica]
MMSLNGRPSLPSRSTIKRVVAAAVVAGVGAGIPVIAAGGATAAPAHQNTAVALQAAAPTHVVEAAKPAAVQAAPQAAPQAAAPAAAPATYTVVSGDWLSKIAASHNVQGGWQKLYELNKSVLTKGPNLIFPGQHLTLATASAPAQAPAQAPAAPAAPAKPQSAPSTPAPAKSAPAKAAPSAKSDTQAASRSNTRSPLAATPAAVPAPANNSVASLQALAASIVPADQLASFDQIISHESGWNITATNPSSGAYGLPQALPGNKMASAGADWQTNPATQLRWALQYMNSTYGSPNAAWAFWQTHSAY